MTDSEFLTLIDAYKGSLHRICHAYRRTKEDRKDLFQDIVYELWRCRKTFQGRSSMKTWMFKVAYYTAIAPLRVEKPKVISASTLPEQADDEPVWNPQKEELMNAMDILDEEDKTILTLYMEQFSYEEIATIVGKDTSHVGVRLYRIKTKIRNHLKRSDARRRSV